jgi:RNA polymerase sigma factor (sigma-70 family)
MSTMTSRPERAASDRLGELYALYARDAVRFAYLLCGDHELAADVVQEAFERVASRLGHLRNPDAFPGYLRKTIRNLLRMRARSTTRDATRADRFQSQMAGNSAVHADTGTDIAIWAAVLRLPERQRAAIVCRYWLDLSTADTARVLSCRPGTVKSLLSRALDTIRLTGAIHDN